MFRTPNPYDELVVAATAETQTDVNWEKFLEICDKVSEEGETGARNAISSILKRLAHRNPNVQTFALELTNSLSENCGKEVHREISSKSFTEGLERVTTDRTTNDKVRKKVLGLIRKWNEVFKEGDEGEIIHELYDRLSKNSEYSQALTGSTLSEPAPEDVERARAAAEDAELQRVLELSKQETGGRGRNGGAAAGGSSSGWANGSGGGGRGGGGSSIQVAQGGAGSSSSGQRTTSLPQTSSAQSSVAPPPPSQPVTPPLQQALRVRALYTYTPTNPTELAFEAGSVIKVIGRTYAEWWRGTLRGRVGIFPVNYVESMPGPTEDELRRERADEDEIFGKIAEFDELLEKLRGVDVVRDGGIPDDVEELYASCVGLQARLGALISKYAGYKADLETISNIFSEAAYSYQTMKNPQHAAPPPHVYAQPHAYAQQQQPQYATPPPDQVQQQAQHHVGPQDQRPAAQQHPSASGHPQAQQQQQQPTPAQIQGMSPEWQAYYAQQAAAARGQAGQIPGQSPAPVAQHQQQQQRPGGQGSQDGHGSQYPSAAGHAQPLHHPAQDPYAVGHPQQQQQQPEMHARHASSTSLAPSNAPLYGGQPQNATSPQPYAGHPNAPPAGGQEGWQAPHHQQQYAGQEYGQQPVAEGYGHPDQGR